MSANIFGARFLGRREPAWHGLGRTFDAPLGALEAVTAACLHFQVVTRPIGFEAPAFTSDAGITIPAGWRPIEGRVAIVREPTPDDDQYRCFGWAGEGYTVIQNTDIGAALDPLTERWPVETIGALDAGKTMFLVLDAGETVLGNGNGTERIHRYFLVTDTKDGGTSLKIAFTPVRVVCQNTLVTGLRQATVQARIIHTKSVAGQLGFRVGLIKQLEQAQGRTLAEFDRLAKALLNTDALEGILRSAYPDPKVGEKAMLAQELFGTDVQLSSADAAVLHDAKNGVQHGLERAQQLRDAALKLYTKFGDEFPGLGGTAWAAYNAVVELEDYREGKGDILVAALFGGRAQAKVRAFAEAIRTV